MLLHLFLASELEGSEWSASLSDRFTLGTHQTDGALDKVYLFPVVNLTTIPPSSIS